MFGRRGAYVINFFTVLLLCLGGLFGLDSSRIMLQYALFVVLCQRNLEGPVTSEVGNLSVNRAMAAIGMSVLVGLTLLPMV
jgi:hypothetical protein